MDGSILIVDDEVDLAEMIGDILASKGYSCTLCCNGIEATKVLSRESFDLIITDLKMPEMSGPELCRWIRKASIPTPIVTMSGNEGEDAELKKLGVIGHLRKPFSIATLLNFVKIESTAKKTGSG